MLEVFPNVKVTLERNGECDNTSVSSKQNSQDFSAKRNKSVKKTTLIRDLVLCPLSMLVSTGRREHFSGMQGPSPGLWYVVCESGWHTLVLVPSGQKE